MKKSGITLWRKHWDWEKAFQDAIAKKVVLRAITLSKKRAGYEGRGGRSLH